MSLDAGTKLGRYEIRSKIGEGGMGEVYLAEDMKLHRKVSLKFLSTSVTQDRERLLRFEQEARAASALNHPNIITIHEIGEDNSHHFIATEYIEGQTLRDRLRAPLDLDEALDIAIQTASALVAAHRVNIIHRDIKPENIMIRAEDGLVKVLDFGLAKMSEAAALAAGSIDKEADTRLRDTAPGVVMGTVAYMSPEQARGETVDARSDIWSLGVVLYEMIAGHSPFVAATSNEIISGILSRVPAPALTRYSPLVPERLEEIVEKALTKNKEERYQTSKDLLIDLKRLQQTLQLKAAGERTTEPDRIATGDSQEQTANARSGTTAATRPQPSSAEYIVSQVKSHKRGALISLTVLLLLIVAGVFTYIWRQRQTSARDQSSIASLAVLPFINATSDPDTEFISDGITDNIIDRLSQIPNLKVTSHSAVFHYKEKQADPRTIGSELGVEAILTGRLIKRNDALTISLELVNAKDNSHIWGEQYDRKMSELLALQREIPLDVSQKLRLKLSGESQERLTRAHTENSEAYQLYLRGKYAHEKWSLDGAKQAVSFFEEAIKNDPNYALAYAGLAEVMMFGRFAGAGLPQKEAHRRGREAATKALSLDPQLGEAHAALAQVLLYEDWDFSGAENEFKRALELNPGYGEGHHVYSHLLLLLGRVDESLAQSQKFLEIDPVSEAPIGHLCYHYVYARAYDEGIAQCRKDIQLYPDTPQGYTLADAYEHKGMFREAFAEYLRALAQDGATADVIAVYRKAFAESGMAGFYRHWLESYRSKYHDEYPADIAEFYARLGEKDQAFEWLEKAYAAHDDGLVRLRENLGFDNLRSDPRYADLLRRVGLPQ